MASAAAASASALAAGVYVDEIFVARSPGCGSSGGGATSGRAYHRPRDDFSVRTAQDQWVPVGLARDVARPQRAVRPSRRRRSPAPSPSTASRRTTPRSCRYRRAEPRSDVSRSDPAGGEREVHELVHGRSVSEVPHACRDPREQPARILPEFLPELDSAERKTRPPFSWRPKSPPGTLCRSRANARTAAAMEAAGGLRWKFEPEKRSSHPERDPDLEPADLVDHARDARRTT